MSSPLSKSERLFYRDRLRAARYAALADSEGFAQICYELEGLGIRLLGTQESLGRYRTELEKVAEESLVLQAMPATAPGTFKSFRALYAIVLKARNDNMHLGAYARHATKAAIELCIGLEDGLMNGDGMKVADVMVSEVMTIDPCQPVAHARQLMLMHSFSFLPLYFRGAWHLLSDLSVAQYLSAAGDLKTKKTLLGVSIEVATTVHGLNLSTLSNADLLKSGSDVKAVLESRDVYKNPTLWLVPNESRPDRLVGILTPFELM